jgi:tetratricopeptide (TPR) repeat protein
MTKSRNQSVIGLAALLLLGSTANGANAQDFSDPEPIAPTPIARPAVPATAAEAAAIKEARGQLGRARLQEVRPETFREVQKYAELPQNQENEEKVKRLDQKAEELFKSGRNNDALLRWQEAYGMSLEMKYSAGQGRALTGMCKVYLTQGKWVKAKQLGENAVEILSGINDHTNLGRARIALAQAYFGLENPVWAVKQLELAMKHLIDQPKSDPAEAANLMRLSGGLLLQFGRTVDAIKFLQESAKYSEEAKEMADALTMHSKISTLMNEVGFYVAAKEEAEKAVSLAKHVKNDRAMISALSVYANSQYVLGEYTDALESYETAYKLSGKLDDKTLSKEGRANLLMGYAFSLIAAGEPDRAEKMLESIIPFFERNGKYYSQTECLNALGILIATRGEPYKALPYFQRAVDAQQMIKPVQPRMQYMLLQNMAAAEYSGGKYREASTHLKSIMAIAERDPKVRKSHPLIVLRTLTSLAEVSLKMADPVLARDYVEKAIELGTKLADDASLWRSYTVLAQLELGQREVEKAKVALENAQSHFRSPQAGYFPTVEGFQFISSRKSLGQQLIALVASQGMTEKALIAAEQLKEEQIINTWIRKSCPVKAEDRDVYKDLVNMRAHLHAAENSTTPNKLTEEWKAWLNRFSELAHRNKALARLIAPYPTSVEDIIAGVRKKKVTIIEYLVGDKSSVAFTIDPIGRISATVLPIGEDRLVSQISPLVTNAGALPEGGESPDRIVLQQLYKQLLPPSVLNFVPNTADKQIVIIPDSVLFNLPFAALIDDQGKYFVENHLLSLATSMGAILDGPMPSGNRLSVLVAQDGSPSDQAESNNISNAVGAEPFSSLSAQATDMQELERVSQDKAVLHVLTNISLSDDNPVKAKLPFAKGETEDSKDNTAGGLFSLSMPNDLVVLSGTSIKGAGQNGKAVQVVSRGLGYAGARNVMMSLWNQPCDTRTAEIANFYKNKKRGMNDAQSLRQAQLLALSEDRNPKAWAAFQLLGAGM